MPSAANVGKYLRLIWTCKILLGFRIATGVDPKPALDSSLVSSLELILSFSGASLRETISFTVKHHVLGTKLYFSALWFGKQYFQIFHWIAEWIVSLSLRDDITVFLLNLIHYTTFKASLFSGGKFHTRVSLVIQMYARIVQQIKK